MSGFQMDVGDGGGQFSFNQGVGDLMAGSQYGDYSRFSAYRGADQGLHTGSNSPTFARGGEPFESARFEGFRHVFGSDG